MNQVDLAALALVLAFAYRGYRSGVIGLLLGLTGGLVAFLLAALLAPLLAPYLAPFVTDTVRLPEFLLRPVLIVGLTLALRFVLGFAVRELSHVIRMAIQAVPPLALLDRLLGIVPGAALGAMLVLALLLVALALPTEWGVRDAAAESWTVRTVVSQPEETLRRLWSLAETLLTNPPRLDGLVLGVGVTTLAAAAVGARQLRGPARQVAFEEAPTLRTHRTAVTEAAGFDPPAVIRIVLGVGVALALAAALMAVIAVTAR
jgi:uncharacterized membrane protein required for colicin V production